MDNRSDRYKYSSLLRGPLSRGSPPLFGLLVLTILLFWSLAVPPLGRSAGEPTPVLPVDLPFDGTMPQRFVLSTLALGIEPGSDR